MQKYEKQQPLPTTFRPMSIVAKRSPISATAELLLRTAHMFLIIFSLIFHTIIIAQMMSIAGEGRTRIS